MVFYWSLSESKSPHVSRTLLNILAVLNDAVVRMVSTHPLTSKSFSPFSNPLVTVPKKNQSQLVGLSPSCSIVFSIPYQGLGTYPSIHILQFYSVVSRDSKVDSFANSIFIDD